METAYQLFAKAFSNKTRFELIRTLGKKTMSVSELCEKTGFEQSRVSHNLKCLENCGFVTVCRKKNFRLYSLEKSTILPMLRLLEKHIKKYEKRLKSCKIIGK